VPNSIQIGPKTLQQLKYGFHCTDYHKLKLAWQLAVKNPYTENHKIPTNGLVASIVSQLHGFHTGRSFFTSTTPKNETKRDL
jgi:hypothetical protein